MNKEGIAARAGRWSAEHRWLSIEIWLAFVVIAVLIGSSVGFETLDQDEAGNGESGQAEEILAEAFPDTATETILIRSDQYTVDDGDFRIVVDNLSNALAATPNVTSVLNPYVPLIDSTEENEGVFSDDRSAALINIEIPEPPEGSSQTLDDLVAAPLATVADFAAQNEGTFEIEEFGEASAAKAIGESYEKDFQKAEKTSLPITLLILLLVFGTVVAALVPLFLGFTAVAGAIGLVGIISQAIPFDESAQSVIFLIGLAVGVDYALFYIRREREERARGTEPRAAIEVAAATSGRAIVVSGLTVAIAMAGMFIAGNATFTSFAIGTIIVVLIAVVGSLTVLPATLSLLGDRVNKLRIPFLPRPEERALRESRIWGAVVDRAMARPLLTGGAAVILLLVLAIPFFSMKMQLPGVDTFPRSLEVMRAYDDIQEEFPGDQFPATIVVDQRAGIQPEAGIKVEELERLAKAEGVAVDDFSFRPNGQQTVVAVDVPIPGDGTNEDSVAALEKLRTELIPATLGQVPGIEYPVTGITAADQDFSKLMRERLGYVFAFVLGLAFLLLLVSFRSIVIPIKAIVLNLLSVGAAYGILVWGFQDGHLEGLLGFESTGAIASWLPLFLFVVLFGLSMDYHVFILSRVREAYDGGMTSEEAVSHGIRTTASVVTAAAIVMVAVFGIFATLSAVEFKQVGVGLAVAILIDATIIRGVLLPASMKLLGDWNWYLPGWLEWLPRSRFEGGPPPAGPGATAPAPTTPADEPA